MSTMAKTTQPRRPRREFDDEFKAGAVRLVLDEGVLPLFAVGNVYVSLCKKSTYAPFGARRKS